MYKSRPSLFCSAIFSIILAISAASVYAEDKVVKPPTAKKLAAGKVQTLPSGVTVETKVAGKGIKPTSSSVVKVHYRGVLDNGMEFDSSYKRGEPATFPLNRVIPCWTEGVATMAVGGKAVLVCPSATAYGERGAGANVPPNSRLTFEVELLDILK